MRNPEPRIADTLNSEEELLAQARYQLDVLAGILTQLSHRKIFIDFNIQHNPEARSYSIARFRASKTITE